MKRSVLSGGNSVYWRLFEATLHENGTNDCRRGHDIRICSTIVRYLSAFHPTKVYPVRDTAVAPALDALSAASKRKGLPSFAQVTLRQ